MQAIENGSLDQLKHAVMEMEKVVQGYGERPSPRTPEKGYCPSVENILDVCYLHFTVSPYTKERTHYYMTLLAHAAMYKQKRIVEYLITEKKASKFYIQLVLA